MSASPRDRLRMRAPRGVKPWQPGDDIGSRGRGLALAWAAATVGAVCITETGFLVRPPAAGPFATWGDWAATAGLIGLANLAFALYLQIAHPEALRQPRRLVLAMGLGLCTLLGARVLAGATVAPPDLPLFTPTAFIAIVLTVARGPRLATEASALLLVQLGWCLRHPPAVAGAWAFPGGHVGTLAVLAAGVLVAVIGARRIRTRSRLVNVGLVLGATQAALVALFVLPDLAEAWQRLPEVATAVVTAGSEMAARPAPVLHDLLTLAAADAGFLLLHGLVLGLLCSGALPFIEYLFEVVTDISLLELSNQEHPLLRRLLLLAPGTFHHSFVVGNLVEAGCESIGANSLLARVGAYFHDVGKSVKPEYFTENEGRKGLIHGRLSPTLSALVIKAHTKDGVALAREYNLPEQIIDFIPQHHGTAVIEYFYQEAISQEEAEGRQPELTVSRDAFRHDGPKPQHKETAVMHLADSVEAATRSLSDPTPSRLRELTHDIIWRKLEDGQLDECPLTFADLRRVEEAFVRVLMGIFHTRIAYPDARKRVAQG